MKTTKNAALLAFGTLLTTLVSANELRMWCDDLTPSPVCCTAVSDSAGVGAEYHWFSNWGGFEDVLTLVNWNPYHCDSTTAFYAKLEVAVPLAQGGSLDGEMHVNCY